MNWKSWAIGALNALVSGAAGAVGGFVVGEGWRKALVIAAISAFVSFSKWMAQHPLPGAANGGDSSSPSNPAPGAGGKANTYQVGKTN